MLYRLLMIACLFLAACSDTQPSAEEDLELAQQTGEPVCYEGGDFTWLPEGTAYMRFRAQLWPEDCNDGALDGVIDSDLCVADILVDAYSTRMSYPVTLLNFWEEKPVLFTKIDGTAGFIPDPDAVGEQCDDPDDCGAYSQHHYHCFQPDGTITGGLQWYVDASQDSPVRNRKLGVVYTLDPERQMVMEVVMVACDLEQLDEGTVSPEGARASEECERIATLPPGPYLALEDPMSEE